MKAEIKALAFDAYGTLFNVQSVETACEQAFPGRGTELSREWRTKQLQYTWLRSLMGHYEDFWQVTGAALTFACRGLGLTCEAEERERLLRSYLALRPFADVEPGLKALAGRPLAILSNGTPAMLAAVVKNARLEEVFTHLISVDEARIYKPSPYVYALGPRRLRLPTEAIGFVSANAWDVAGAKAFGYWTCWLNRTGAPMEELGFLPDVIVQTLGELADKLH